MFKTAATKIATIAVAAVCAISMTLSAGTAEAKVKKEALVIGGAILGGAILNGLIIANSNASQPRYVEVEQECWKEKRIVGYRASGRPIVRRVVVCE
jgi:hypothetical protein